MTTAQPLPHRAAEPSADRLTWLLDLVEDSLDEADLDGKDLAARAFLSRYHFDRLVRAALGEPPGAFRRRLLLERAAHRLCTSDVPVIEVAWEAGYGSPEAFSRAFARAYAASPSAYRRVPGPPDPGRRELPTPNGIHFHPPGGLRLPSPVRRDPMDLVTRMVEHHLCLVGEIVDRTAGLDDAVLDRRIEMSVEGIDDAPTLRGLADRLVGQLEMWVSAVEGATRMPPDGDTDAAGLRRRLEVVAPRFRELVLGPVTSGRAEETFVDAVCDPPQTFTFAGVLAHVLTFAAVRRTMAIGALETAGVTDLGSGDPMRFVGGQGDDASSIRRT